jgi:hypothetical protein
MSIRTTFVNEMTALFATNKQTEESNNRKHAVVHMKKFSKTNKPTKGEK